jgi:hypothetical protein
MGKLMTEKASNRYSVEVHASEEDGMGAGTLSVSVSETPTGTYIYIDGFDGWNLDAGAITVQTAAALAEAFSGAVAAALGNRPAPPVEPPGYD